MASGKINWDSDVVKHYVRRNAWLPAARSQAQASRKVGREPRYLTFCASQALDVFLFLKEGVLIRDPETDVVINTYFCEQDDEDFNEITRLVGAHEQGFFGDFKDLILFEDDENTTGLGYDNVSRRYAPDLRKKLSMKFRHERLKSVFPFDVVNLDPYGTFFPPLTGVLSQMLKSIRTFLDWQTEAAENEGNFVSFTMFLTTHVQDGRVHPEAFNEMVDMIQKNCTTYAGFSQSLDRRFGTGDAKTIAQIDFSGFYSIALPKVIVSEAFKRGWNVSTNFAGQYLREGNLGSSRYSMLNWVAKFYRQENINNELGLSNAANTNEYALGINELTRQTKDVDQALIADREPTKSDLDEVVSYREQYLRQILSTN